MSAPTNGCGACGEDFTSVKLFDRHRVGTHEYTSTEGLKMNPPREDGRRCLDPDEMRARGWGKDAKGRWQDPVRVAAARIAFSHLDTKPTMPLEAAPGDPGATEPPEAGTDHPQTVLGAPCSPQP